MTENAKEEVLAEIVSFGTRVSTLMQNIFEGKRVHVYRPPVKSVDA